MRRILKKYTAEIIILVVLIFVMSSCQTIREVTMNDQKRATQCSYVNR